ncbi:sterol desaturase family protein [candidate division KSB1 bacterium]|nr:sterol desaturase family protein [candidate division KSB1 bacterium]
MMGSDLRWIKIIVPIFAFLIILALQSIWPLFKERTGQWIHGFKNVGMFILNSVIIALLFSTITVIVLNLADATSWSLATLLHLPRFAKLILLILFFDAWTYIWHRLNHTIPFFWRFHRMHHTDRDMDITTAQRFHVGELILSSILRMGIFLLIGMDVTSLLIYETVMMPIIYFHHSNIRLPDWIDRTLRTVIVTPWMHWVHHSDIREETDSNYGAIFSFWDRLFGSFRIRKDPDQIQYGLKQFTDPMWQSFTGMLKTPFLTVPTDSTTFKRNSTEDPS